MLWFQLRSMEVIDVFSCNTKQKKSWVTGEAVTQLGRGGGNPTGEAVTKETKNIHGTREKLTFRASARAIVPWSPISLPPNPSVCTVLLT